METPLPCSCGQRFGRMRSHRDDCSAHKPGALHTDMTLCPADPNGHTCHEWHLYEETKTHRWYSCRNCGAEESEPVQQIPT
jgi:hypothetical protein